MSEPTLAEREAAFESAIIAYGIENSCRWFGHKPDSQFTKDTKEWAKEARQYGKPVNLPKLGAVQRSCLEGLKKHGGWCRGCGWYWDTWSNTHRIMDSLASKKVAQVDKGQYTITELGRKVLEA
jgi:hypothetical protein